VVEFVEFVLAWRSGGGQMSGDCDDACHHQKMKKSGGGGESGDR